MQANYKKGVGLGFVFFIMFWLSLDSLALGIGLGIAMGAAFSAPESKGNSRPSTFGRRPRDE